MTCYSRRDRRLISRVELERTDTETIVEIAARLHDPLSPLGTLKEALRAARSI